jgi:hypothetical protein
LAVAVLVDLVQLPLVVMVVILYLALQLLLAVAVAAQTTIAHQVKMVLQEVQAEVLVEAEVQLLETQ